MTYFCFVESSLIGVQHMQPLDAECVETARSEAAVLLLQHNSAYAAHIFAGDEHVLTIQAAELAS